jgi:hypothetical protein
LNLKHLEDLGFSILAKGDTYVVASNKSDSNRWIELGYDINKQIVEVFDVRQHEKGGTIRNKVVSIYCENTVSLKTILENNSQLLSDSQEKKA